MASMKGQNITKLLTKPRLAIQDDEWCVHPLEKGKLHRGKYAQHYFNIEFALYLYFIRDIGKIRL